MYRVATVFLALLVALGAAWAEDNPLAKVEGQADLEKAKRAKFRETYVNTSIDWIKYNKVYLGDAVYDYRDVGPAERYRTNLMRHSNKAFFGISEEDRKKFEEEVDKAWMKEFEKGKNYTITEDIDEYTMIIRGGLVDIVSRVPPEFVGRSEIYLARVGEATLILEFVDPSTGEIMARVAERRAIQRPGGQIDMMSMPTNSVTVWADVRRWASNAARRLSAELDDAIEGN